jgi:PqqD family protein of HPr-rel-A system
MHCWGGECAVFNRLSGDTHLLDVVSSEVLRIVTAGTVETEQLCQKIAEFLDLPNSADLKENVSEILASLDELGLIEPADAC